ncbi:MAG: chloride channel protein [Chitinophagaceae bacterium]|nr:chloride channel protein [Chitinophagaceae bacterium]HNE93120.1 chloride channel protein [Chitinophagaceae bacterium]
MLIKGIPISLSLNNSINDTEADEKNKYQKKRLIKLSLLAIAVAMVVSGFAKVLVHLIDLITNIAFYQNFSFIPSSPANNSIGWWVVLIPVVGGLLVGIMALYGSKAIRGHGIPEAMEQILTNQSKIKPSITFLKPISAAISIGTGGPFGAEGPIIATGGALGSTLGQILKITPNERKILLASGATAGMSAIFGSPIAAIFLAIELLLFEFSPRSFIPVALACITGAAGHHFLFSSSVVFPMLQTILPASNKALLFYSIMGVAVGILSVIATKIVYWIEDAFEKLPIHWALWPAIGGIAVGLIGYYEPKTLGVGYNNITDVLSGTLTFNVILSLCLLKFTSWAIAIGSGTSGGTLAPLLTIGGAIGALLGILGNQWFPAIGISIPLCALVGMSAMFAGASRAFLTSIVFALETTGQSNALLPLLATCTGAYCVSYLLMTNTIMTEKIARRGVQTPTSYEPDILDKTLVEELPLDDVIILNDAMNVGEVRTWLKQEADAIASYFIVSDLDGTYKGLISYSSLFNMQHNNDLIIGDLVKRKNIFIQPSANLKTAVETMSKEDVDILPVIEEDHIIGILTYQNILSIYKRSVFEKENKQVQISLSRQRLKMLVRGQKIISILKSKKANT